MTRLRALFLAAAFVAAVASPAFAQPVPADQVEKEPKRADVFERTPPIEEQIRDLRHALTRLPIAAGLACVLAFRPRRKGTPERQMPVIQTQIILAVVGAVVMLVVGSSLARAFGIVGAAGLVRYRAKIDDPKDAGVMLSTLAVGLAAGVGVWLLAGFATLFILALLWVVESFEPKATQLFTLKVKAKDPAAIKPKLDALLTRYRLDAELRGTSPEELHYEVRMPSRKKTNRLSERIMSLDGENMTEVEWEEKKEKK
ncbi:MAG TPA: DUF4956 domain-containing protein [Vicinamibacterales bacterium]|jgi:hypothetical protein|nr:DUF4956 domain-containing protein [Vicinamibacterales bacterium]